MGEPPTESGGGETGPPDRHVLRLLERRLADEPLIERTEFRPDAETPYEIVIHLDADQYPESTRSVRLDVQWFTTGDFSLHYVETHADSDRWECRWDRHPNPHANRVHFHVPPAAADVENLELPSIHPLDVSSTVVAAIQDPLKTLWVDES